MFCTLHLVMSNCVTVLQVELFRELQLVNSDYLRQRALYNIQDLVTRFLTGDDEITPTHRVVSIVVYI